MKITLKDGPLYVIATVPKTISLNKLTSSHANFSCYKKKWNIDLRSIRL